jgi:hypothetical protein
MPTNDLNFIPIDREIRLDPNRAMLCKFNTNGLIEYVNDYYVEISGFEVHEVVGNGIETLKHSELPLTIFNHVMEHVKEGKNINVIIKDQARDGRYYWFFTDFEFKKDNDNNLISFVSSRKAAPRPVLSEIENFYQKLLKIEQHSGAKVAKTYFDGFNEENGMTFNDYNRSLILNYGNIAKPFTSSPTSQQPILQENKSIFSKIFKK